MISSTSNSLPMPEPEVDPIEAKALCRSVLENFGRYAKLNKSISKELMESVGEISSPSKLADTVAAHFAFKVEDKQRLLDKVDPAERVSDLVSLIKMEIEVLRMDQRIKGRVKEQMEKTQRNYYLNEQMRAIKKEMGAEDDPSEELEDLEKRIKAKKMSEEGTEKVKQEFRKLKMMTPMSAEATVVRNYIDWLISLPWFDVSEINQDLAAAERILDEDHYGLEKPKERIIEYLAVQTLTRKVKGPILCLVGPPGVGKTSLAKSVSRATGRKYVRLSLGGVRDEAEIRGHRRTYIGAMPGKIMQSLKKAGVNNPVFCLDEVDKMSMDFRGDPSAALAGSAGSGAELQLQRPLPGCGLRSVGYSVHHHGQHAARYSPAVAGPYGNHPFAGVYRIRKIQHCQKFFGRQADRGQRP